MKTYRNRRNGTEIEAIQLSEDTAAELANWTQGQLVDERNSETGEEQTGVNVETYSGRKRACTGDYVVQHLGAFYVIKPQVFDDLYEEGE